MGGGLWVVSMYRQNKCDKHSTVLQIQMAPNKSPDYLDGNSNCMNKCVSQARKNVDSYEVPTSELVSFPQHSILNINVSNVICLSTHSDILHNYLNTVLQSCKIRLLTNILPCLNITAVQY